MRVGICGQLRLLFARLDTDSDGRVSISEFAAHIRDVGSCDIEDRLRAFTATLNSGDLLTYKELEAFGTEAESDLPWDVM